MKSNLKLKILLLFTVMSMSLFASALPTFIMQAVSYFKVSPASAGTLESYQNLTLVVITFIAFSYILKVGYRKTLITIMGLMATLSIICPFVGTYWMIKLFLIGVGITLVGMKVCIYAAVSLVTENEKQHASFLSIAEATFMLGYTIGMWIMGFFIKILPNNWMLSLAVFGCVAIVSSILWCLTPLDESKLAKEENLPFKQQVLDILGICKSKIVIAAILIYFVEQFVECGIMAWMAGFYEIAIHVPKSLSVWIASLTFFIICFSRILVAFLLKYIKWEKLLFFYYLFGFILLVLILFTIYVPATQIKTLLDVPISALLLPIIGFFLAPSVPVLNSAILNKTTEGKQALLMTVMTIVFAISSSAGARVFGDLIENLGGIEGFRYATLIPFAILVVTILPYAKSLRKTSVK